MTTTCTRCGADFTPAPDAYRRGTWRTSTRCRGDPGDEASGVVEANSRAADAILEPPSCPLNPKGYTP